MIQLSADDLDAMGLTVSDSPKAKYVDWKNPRTGKIERTLVLTQALALTQFNRIASEKAAAILDPDMRDAAKVGLGKPSNPAKNQIASLGQIKNAGNELQPQRTDWNNFPKVELIEPAKTIATHASYHLAKQGDLQAAITLVDDVLDVDALLHLKALFEQYKPDYIQPIHAEEQMGRNKLPIAFGLLLSHHLDVPLGLDIVQSSRAYRTGADGNHRLIERVGFDGVAQQSARYFIIDDAITQGGTLADMRSYIVQQGGLVVGASTLMGKPHSAIYCNHEADIGFAL